MTDTLINVPEFSVSELSRKLKKSVEDQFGYVRVRAELSGVKRAASGHVYFALKDADAVLDGVMWRGQAAKLGFQPEDGLEVVCTGQLTTYPARSKYQMKVDQMNPAGAGALMALLEERKKKLAAEGLFAPERKRPIPFLPRTIGVVTSPTGAVIRDILHRLADRCPSHVRIWPVKVQGEGAATEIASAIAGFNAMDAGTAARPDLLIVARGGGSIEDLWAFNEEVVVRAAANSAIPLISAVGHETDTTLIDFAADRRAPTPTGAAEMAVPVRGELQAQIADLDRRMTLVGGRLIADRRERVRALARAMPRPADLLGMAGQRVDDLGERLPKGLRAVVTTQQAALARFAAALKPSYLKRQTDALIQSLHGAAARLRPAAERHLHMRTERLAASARLLASLGYENTLSRGYALVFDSAGAVVKDQARLKSGAEITLRFRDGERGAVIDGGQQSASSKPKPRRKSKPQHDADKQGQLFD